MVVNPFFDWGSDRHPRIPYHETVIYEAHVKGLTNQHPDIPEELRGTYTGLAHPVMIEHLKRLGVTAVELMPVHEFITDHHLQEKGLANYWGYNTIAFLAPHHSYAQANARPGSQVQEFKAMVRELHNAGIEVILDVVYNHTAEGNHMGPTLSMRGIDNAAYYRLVDDDPHYYMDYTGTGNSLNVRNPHTLQLIMDSLRYWVTEMHVDGFRFDLASTLAREFYDVDRLSVFFDLVQQDPVISQAKLIAEPWDVGPGGYQVGNFPPLWTEWNGKYRDTVRDFWRGEPGTLGEFTSRLTGSSDLYQADGRRPFASINFVTAHDGFTLNDLVSYNEKHNDANGEGGNDGESHNRSWNCGVEGPTDDADGARAAGAAATQLHRHPVPVPGRADAAARRRDGPHPERQQQRLRPGQRDLLDGLVAADQERGLVGFTAGVAALRAGHPVFRRRRFFAGKPIGRSRGTEGLTALPDIAWFTPSGEEMTEQDWDSGFGKCCHGVPQRQRHHRGRQPRRAGHGRLVPPVPQRRTTKTSRSPSRRRSTARAGRSSSTPRSARCSRWPPGPVWWRPTRRASRAGRSARCRPARSSSCSGREHEGVIATDTTSGSLRGSAGDRSTYRIQFSSATTLQQGAELVPYLDALGVGAVYASPLLAGG